MATLGWTLGASQQITHLEQQAIDLRLQLEEQGQDLAAARAANRELMALRGSRTWPLLLTWASMRLARIR